MKTEGRFFDALWYGPADVIVVNAGLWASYDGLDLEAKSFSDDPFWYFTTEIA